jgi:hypothetical protein
MNRTLLSTICFIGLGGMPHERAVFSAPEGAVGSGGGGGSGGAAPTGAAPTSAPKTGAATPPAPGGTTQQPRPTTDATQTPAAKPTREPWKVKHKHRLSGDDGAEARELELELDLTEHLAGYKRKVKADGRELEVTVDEAFERYPLAQGAFSKMEEAAQLRTRAEQQIEGVRRLDAMMRDPDSASDILRATLGEEKFLDMAFKVVADRIGYEKMTPQQRAQHDRDQKAAADARKRDREIQQRERTLTEREKAINQRDADALRERFMKEWPAHLEAAGVPTTDTAISMMAGVMQEYRKVGHRITPEQAAREVRSRIDALLGGIVKGDPERVRGLLGEDGANKLRQLEVQKLEEQPGRTISVPEGQQQPTPRPTQRTQEPQSLEALRAQMRRDRIAEEQKRFRR